MKRAAILLPLVFTLFGVIILWQSLTLMVFFDYDRGAPGPGFLPFWVSLAVVLLGGIAFVQAILREPSAVVLAEWPDRIGFRRVAIIIGLLAIYILLFQVLGFLVSSVLFMIAASYSAGYRSMKILVPVSVAFGLGVYLLFVVWLRVSLPQGLIPLHY